MKIVNATWEMRNLNKKTIEVTLEKKDLLKSVDEIIVSIKKIEQEYKPGYLVIKILTGNPYIGNELYNNDFIYMETQIHLKALRNSVEKFLKDYDGLFDNTKIEKVTDQEEIEFIVNEINKGIFYTDRIALDPNFGIEIANKRYINWLKDEIECGTDLYCISIENKKVGFSLRRYNNNSIHDLLAGVFKEYQNLKIGGNVYYAALSMDFNKGCKKFYTAVSSNNIVSLRLHEMLGYKVDFLQEVYIKHY